MLTKIHLTNFKCFEHLDLTCAPLTLLTGLNGMGKSSVIQALLVLRQSFETRELHDGNLLLAGARADLGTGMEVLYEEALSDVIEIDLHTTNPSLRRWTGRFEYSQSADRITMPDEGEDYDALFNEAREVPPFGGDLVYVKAERVGPRKTYPTSEVLARRGDLGDSGEFAWNYLRSRQEDLLPSEDPRRADSKSRRFIDIVDLWMQDVCPGSHIQLDAVPAADVVIAGFSFDRPGYVPTRRFRATNVGFGLSYALPVIVALMMPADTLCLIENPEAHLHPRGQTKLAELAALATQAGVQVFVETHSDHFVDGVRIAVREGLIPPDDVAIHYFEREGNKAVVKSPQVDLDGRLSEWPESFFDQHGENLIKLLGPKT